MMVPKTRVSETVIFYVQNAFHYRCAHNGFPPPMIMIQKQKTTSTVLERVLGCVPHFNTLIFEQLLYLLKSKYIVVAYES